MKAGPDNHVIDVMFRDANRRDIEAIAALHADSWRRHYRGAYADSYLDGDVFADRLAVWTARLTTPAPNGVTIVADLDGAVAGFAHAILDDDPNWGALLDNLHVRHDLKREGIGRRLMAETAQAVMERTPASGLYLWVLEQNTAAQAFYDSLGGECVGRQVTEPAGGGSIVGLRYVWREPSILVERE